MSRRQKPTVVINILIVLFGIVSISACSDAKSVSPDSEMLERNTPLPLNNGDATDTKPRSTSLATATEDKEVANQPQATPISPIPLTNTSATPTLVPGPPPVLEPIDIYFIEHGSRRQPLVALTFDLCQDPSNPSGFDEGIYRVLVNAEVPATFFMGGDWMRTHIDETRMLASIPYFEFGNHSWSHPDFRALDEVDMSREILRTHELLYQLTGQQSKLMRFPGGTYNTLALSVAAWHGMRSIQWDVVIADPVPDNTAAMILERVDEQVKNGSILVMHANERGWHTAEALPLMVRNLRKDNYCLVTISQLLGLEPLPQECGGEQDFLRLAPGGHNQ
jgi:peptidoglycan/xylan/chitin deacetylase (PgdA/CDA1 family)